MGCSTKIYLPPNVRIQDVATVIGILSGDEKKKKYFNEKSLQNEFYVTVNNVKFSNCPSHPECAWINIKCQGSVLEITYQASGFWMFENDIFPGWKYLSFGSREYSIKIVKALMEFFGGMADYNDCEGNQMDIEVEPKPDSFNYHKENKDYEAFQEALWNLKPIE